MRPADRRLRRSLMTGLIATAMLPAAAVAALPVAGGTYHTDPEMFNGVYDPEDGSDGKADVQLEVANQDRRRIDEAYFYFVNNTPTPSNDNCARSAYNVAYPGSNGIRIDPDGHFKYDGEVRLAQGPNPPRRGNAVIAGDFVTSRKAEGRVVHRYDGCQESARFTARFIGN